MFRDKQSNSKHIRLGKHGENIAAKFIEEMGIEIIERNHRNLAGEIDIIGREKDRTLIFYEVKTMNDPGPNNISPEDNFSHSKKKKLVKSCMMFVDKHSELVTEKGWRIDLITLTIYNNNYVIKIYENV